MTDGILVPETSAAPGRILIGVTGHRSYNDPELVRASVEAVLDRLLGGGAEPVIVTSLAEGADRLVTELVLARGGAAEVILPLAADDYSRDFASEQSRAHFAELLGRAADAFVVGRTDGSREGAYEIAGRAVVDRSDVLIAVWDGAPARGRGGTAAVIQYAVERDVMVEVVLVDRDPAP